MACAACTPQSESCCNSLAFERCPTSAGAPLFAATSRDHLPSRPGHRFRNVVIAAGNTVAASIATPSDRGVPLVELNDRGPEIREVSVFFTEDRAKDPA